MAKLLQYSSLTKKFIMAIAGLFLAVFLMVHLCINLFILPITENHVEIFELAVHFMTTNPLIKAFEVVLFGGFLIHIIYGLILQIQNWMARPNPYKVKPTSEQSLFSRFMIHTGVIIFVFLIIHLGNFFVKVKFTHEVGEFILNGVSTGMEDMGIVVVELFKLPGYVAFYVIALLILGFHLDHGIQSAFQSLGLNHKKYTPFIKGLGRFLAIVITLGYISIPLVIYFN